MSLITDVESFFTGVESEAQAAIAPMLPWVQGVYVLVKNDAETALKAAGSEVVTMATADFKSLLATVQSAVATANNNTSLTGAQKFEMVASSILTQVGAGLWPTIKVIGTAALNTLINSAYAGLASGVLGAAL